MEYYKRFLVYYIDRGVLYRQGCTINFWGVLYRQWCTITDKYPINLKCRYPILSCIYFTSATCDKTSQTGQI